MTSKTNAQDRKDFEKFTKFFIYKSIQIIVQSRLGEKAKSKSKVVSSGADWFNIAIADNNEVQAESKKVLANQSSTLAQTVCIEISLRTAELESMVLELWYISLDTSQCDNSAKLSQSCYYRMGVALKSLLSVTRVTPAYKLSRRQGSSDFVICYRLYLGEPHFLLLGEDSQKSKVGCVPTPYGTVAINLSYRTKLHISPQNTSKGMPFEVKDDHFKLDGSPVRPTTPRPCISGFRRSSTSESETGGGQSEESCTTTFSTSPMDAPKVVGTAPHHQSQPIKINLQGTSPISDRFPDFRTQSAPEKQTMQQECRKVGAFAKDSFVIPPEESDDDIPFICLLRMGKEAAENKVQGAESKTQGAESKVQEAVKSPAKADNSKGDTSEPNLTESKASTSSQASAPDDFVMVELKVPFAPTELGGFADLGKFYRDCLTAPALEADEEERQSVPETLEQIASDLDYFESNMKDFDNFLAELSLVDDVEN